MGKTSTAAKRKYNEKAYDRFSVTFPKGMKEVYQKQAEERGYKSLNNYINKLIEADKTKASE